MGWREVCNRRLQFGDCHRHSCSPQRKLRVKNCERPSHRLPRQHQGLCGHGVGERAAILEDGRRGPRRSWEVVLVEQRSDVEAEEVDEGSGLVGEAERGDDVADGADR